MVFKWGRKDCANEERMFRQFPGPDSDPRNVTRRSFRLNLEEVSALMGV